MATPIPTPPRSRTRWATTESGPAPANGDALPGVFRHALPAMKANGWTVAGCQPWRPTRRHARLLAVHPTRAILYLIAQPWNRSSTERDGWPAKANKFYLSLDGRAWYCMTGAHRVGYLLKLVASPPVEINRDRFAPLVEPPNGLRWPCRCNKEKFTETAAARTLIRIIEERSLKGSACERKERRSYRCPDDWQVFHLTSAKTPPSWYRIPQLR